jgi:23S rRNA pseudouridine1911/1915/1917 synthase
MKYEYTEPGIRIHPEEKYKGKTLDNFFEEFALSRKNRYLLVQKGKILLDDVPAKRKEQKLSEEDITILLEPEEVDWAPAEEEAEVVYEDPFLYLVHKPAGLIIHSDDKSNPHCLNAYAARYQINHGIQAPVRPIHRLDEDTEGLVLYVKMPFFQAWFDQELAQKKIGREYLAAVQGRLKPGTKFTVNQPIGRDRHHAGQYLVSRTGKEAVTHFEVLDQKGPYSLLRCQLETGRTHQIRVHLAWKGLPIVNDFLYGSGSRDFPRMGLWADAITIRNPITRKKHRIHDRPSDLFAYFGKGED